MTRSCESFTTLVDKTTEAEWNSLLEGFADASIYQTWAYGAVCWGEKQLSHLVLLRDGIPAAMAQVRIVRVPVLGSGIAYVRWGPVCVRKNSAWDSNVWQAVTEALIQEYVRQRGLMLRVLPSVFRQDPIADAACGIWSRCGLVQDVSQRPYHTVRIHLRSSVDTLRRALSSRWRRQLNIAERNGLKIVEGQTDDLYQQFQKLYGEMLERKQFETSVDVDDFRGIQQCLPASLKMRIFTCLAADTPVAGLVVAPVGNTAIYLLAATGHEGLDARGSYLLQWHAIQRLKELGIEWYDLGGVNEAVNPGVFTFKDGMGGDHVCLLGRYQFSVAGLSRLSVLVGEGITRAIRTAARKR